MEGFEIKKFRQKHRLTQADLAVLVGVKTGTVSKWESGIRNIGQSAIKIIENYDPDIGDAVKEEKKPDPNYGSIEDVISAKVLEDIMPIIEETRKMLLKSLMELNIELSEMRNTQEELLRLQKLVKEKVDTIQPPR
jgi:transcriptional regulator with XRE-family HTH domain